MEYTGYIRLSTSWKLPCLVQMFTVKTHDTLRSELGEGKGGSNQSWAPPRPQEGKGSRAESRQEREHADRSHVT